MSQIGAPVSRIDGKLKVSGQARYAGDHVFDGLLHGVIVSSGVAKGRILSIDSSAARGVGGVVEIVTHENRPSMSAGNDAYGDGADSPGSPFRPLYDDRIMFSGQPVALVVAESFEAARFAATLVKMEYETEPHNTDFRRALAERFVPDAKREIVVEPSSRGDARAAFAGAPYKVQGDYRLATEHHNPMEPFASTVVWEGDGGIVIHDKTQGPQNVQSYIASVFEIPAEKVRVLNPFVGGAFGAGLRPQYQVVLAALAVMMLKRTVRVTMTRQQMFTFVHRPQCEQNISLAAQADGRLAAILMRAANATSRFENYMENIVNWGAIAYACENVELDAAIAPMDTATPGDMRAPGAATGMNLFEIAMDELAYVASIDPLELRMINYSDKNAMTGAPYTSKALMAAYKEGAAQFGWARRNHQPRSMRDGKELVGWGVATGIWEALMVKASASAKLDVDGRLEVASATSDIGTGTYTILAQIAADALGLPIEAVTVRLGDSRLPQAPLEGGSFTAASVGAAVHFACRSLGGKLLLAAERMDGKPLGEATFDDIEFVEGSIRVKRNPSRALSIRSILAASGSGSIEARGETDAHDEHTGEKARNTHSAVFAEVKVDEELGLVRVTRIVCAVAAGRIINPKTARSQIVGGVVMGLGMALHEESVLDDRIGRFMNHDFAGYHVPTHADIFDIETIFVDEPDPEVSPLGVKGVGEIGVVGTAAAIANAIFHATGKRIRELPITIDKLLA
ncbi:xanthine dehydrogenase family protein molybdopterin-binding subunit [Methylocystis sp. S23]